MTPPLVIRINTEIPNAEESFYNLQIESCTCQKEKKIFTY